MRSDQVGGAIRWRMHIRVSPDRVFSVLNSDDGRASFWAESAVEKEGYIDFRFINGEQFKSKVLERQAATLFAIEYFGGPARFELSPDGSGGTDLF